MKLGKTHWIGIIIGLVILIIDFIFFTKKTDTLMFLMGIAFSACILPFIFGVILETKRQQQVADMFLEFSRNLSESVNTGTPISKSVVNMRNKNYGPLSPYVIKLANQISIGIPVNQAMQNFAYDVGNPVISRAINLIREAEKAGGEIDYILESAAKSIAEVEKLKSERKAAVSSLVVQGYIIFFIFIAIMMIMEFKIIPLTTNISSYGGFSGDFSNLEGSAAAGTPVAETAEDPAEAAKRLAAPFLYLLLTQGLFAGFIIGKLTEGTLKAGMKHSFILTITAFLVLTGARVILN